LTRQVVHTSLGYNCRSFSALLPQSQLTSLQPSTSAQLTGKIKPVFQETKRFALRPANIRALKFDAEKKRKRKGFTARVQTPGGRAILWRRIIKRNPTLGS